MTDQLQERITTLEQRLATQPKSPLFARLASYYLQSGRPHDALSMCDEGLAVYPFYTTAHLIKGKALAELNMLAEAKREFEVVYQLLPTNEAVARLYSSVDLGPSVDLMTPAVAEAGPEPETAIAETYYTPSSPEVVEEQPTTTEEMPAAYVEEPQAETPSFEEPPSIQIEEPYTSPVEEEVVLPSETPESQPEPYSYESSETVELPAVEEAQTPAEPVASYDFSDPLAALRGETTEETATAEVDFGAIETPTEGTPSIEAAPGEAVQPDYFDAFSQLQQATEEAIPSTTPEQPVTEEESPFAAFGTEPEPFVGPGETVGEEPFEEFAARTRMELFGQENTSTLEEYLGSISDSTPAAPAPSKIEELAEKLKTPTKITPVINFAEKATRTVSEEDTPSGTGFVTPTLAEIYVKQGWFDDAIKAYKTLALNKPAEREKYDKRIAELEEMKKSKQ